MLVLMMPVSVDMFVSVGAGLVPVLVSVMAVGASLVAMLVLMLVLAVAAHPCLTSFFLYVHLIINISPLPVNESSAQTRNQPGPSP